MDGQGHSCSTENKGCWCYCSCCAGTGFHCVWVAERFDALASWQLKPYLHDRICRMQLSCWRMETSADSRFLLIRLWLTLKSDVCTRVFSITYARGRIVNDQSQLGLHIDCRHSSLTHWLRLFLYMSLHFTSLHFTSLHSTSLHFTSLRLSPLHFTNPLHSTSLHFTPLYLTPPHSTSPHFTPFRSTSLHFTSPHSTSRHSALLNSTSSHLTSLHFIPFHSISLNSTIDPTQLNSIQLMPIYFCSKSCLLQFTCTEY